MSNLLKETKECLAKNNKTPDDIIFIGIEHNKKQCSWDEFVSLANIEYDGGYGSAEINEDLIIVFEDGSRMYREEYDGSEWWEFMGVFTVPEYTEKLTTLKNEW